MKKFSLNQFMQVTDVTLMVSNIETSLKFSKVVRVWETIEKIPMVSYKLGTYTNTHLITLTS